MSDILEKQGKSKKRTGFLGANELTRSNSGSSRRTVVSERQQLAMFKQMEKNQAETKDGHDTSDEGDDREKRKCHQRRNEKGETSLHLAARKGDIAKLKKLINSGVSLQETDYAGWTPLHEACMKNQLGAMEYLLEQGADVNARGFGQSTPLHGAVLNENIRAVEILMKFGANPTIRNVDRLSVLDLCRANMSSVSTNKIYRVITESFGSDKACIQEKMVDPEKTVDEETEQTESFEKHDPPADHECFKSCDDVNEPQKKLKRFPESEEKQPCLEQKVPPLRIVCNDELKGLNTQPTYMVISNEFKESEEPCASAEYDNSSSGFKKDFVFREKLGSQGKFSRVLRSHDKKDVFRKQSSIFDGPKCVVNEDCNQEMVVDLPPPLPMPSPVSPSSAPNGDEEMMTTDEGAVSTINEEKTGEVLSYLMIKRQLRNRILHSLNPDKTDEKPLNSIKKYEEMRKEAIKRRNASFHGEIPAKFPSNLSDFYLVKRNYLWQNNADLIDKLKKVSAPENLCDLLKEVFETQEQTRYELRLKHQIERDKLILAYEHEILRCFGRASRAAAHNQDAPFSVCSLVRCSDVYNIDNSCNANEESMHRSVRDRFNFRHFNQWLQDTRYKFEKIRSDIIKRQKSEAECLYVIQCADWKRKIKELYNYQNPMNTEVMDEVEKVAVNTEWTLTEVFT